MRTKTSKIVGACILGFGLVCAAPKAHAVCPPPATPQNCATIAFCATMSEETKALKNVDKGFVKKLKEVAKKIFQAIDDMDNHVAKSIQIASIVQTHATRLMSDERTKVKEVISKARQRFAQEENTYRNMIVSNPGKNFVDQTTLKSYTPAGEVLTRAVRQTLYQEQTTHTELVNEQFYDDESNKRSRAYHQGTIAGMAKIYETHTNFFCNAAGANKPAQCGSESSSEGVKMGDQMLEIYFGDGTWPKEQVQQAIELMKFYLGISPPDLPNTSDFSTGEGQRAYMEYQAGLARNNFMTYILTYLASRRAPTIEGQGEIAANRKKAAGCDVVTDMNRDLCSYYDKIVESSDNQSSMAQLNRILNFERVMNNGFMNKAVSDTMGLEKDRALMLADSIKQDYDAYQMDKMITATMAGYYASLVGN
jgi:hypothetical protein